ncbi:CheY-like chemotaxis protein [Breoghania corrubedonensis]|uniref:CheY-like chemotaxis protein n=1 Tax=Breoghania corrubedonensis TaxID=665038 RepID=A0A2T5UW97_9HYPH|nr:response regulator [Breoghania corrubedonensis]PTW55787.1 CheY-like chemotaxis protein [Breoghania corrubedonensis]
MQHPHALGPSVLIIAEGPSFCMLLEQMLHDIGVAATTTIDEAEAAQSWLRANAVDAVLIDSDLPKASALAFANRIRCDTAQFNRYLPLVLMSAKGDAVLMHQAVKAGFDSSIPKPVRRRQLFGELKRLLERPRVYIRSPSGYCGPDRRRRVMSDYAGEDRRREGSFQLFTENGPVSRDALEALHRNAPEGANMDVLLVRGAQVIDSYRLDSSANLRRANG